MASDCKSWLDKTDAISSELSAPRSSYQHEEDARKVPGLQPPLHLRHPSTLIAGDLPTRQSYPGPGFSSGYASNNNTCSHPAMPAASPLLSATRQTYSGFDFGRAAINDTCPPQFSSVASAWNPLPNAPPFCYNTFGPRVPPATDPREMMNFSFYQNSFMVNF